MKKTLLIWILSLVLLLSVGFVSAVPVAPDSADTIAYWALENLTDETANSYDLTASGASSGATGILNNGYSFDGVNNKLSVSGVSTSWSAFSVSLWVKCTTRTDNRLIYLNNGNDAEYGFVGLDSSKKFRVVVYSNPNTAVIYSDSTHDDSDWHHVVFTVGGGTVKLYVDGVLQADTDSLSLNWSLNTVVTMGVDRSNFYDFAGVIDEVSIFDVALTQDEVDYLYASGSPSYAQQYPFSSAVVSVNSSTESTAVVKQVGSVSFVNPTTIISSGFNVLNNDTPLYGGYSFNVESNNNNLMRCELFIDGVSQANVTRSQQTGVLGSVFIQSDVLMLDAGNHSQSLVCQRSGGLGLTTVSNAVGIGHFLVDEYNNTLPYNDTHISAAGVSSGSSYSLIDSFNVTVGNKTIGNNITHNLVVEGQLTYTNLGVSSEVLGAYIEINGTNSSFYPRTVASGATGSVALDFIIENATTNETYTVNIYANGTDAQYNGNFIAKDLFIDEDEIEGGTGIITGVNFIGDTDTRIFNISAVGNFNHPVANAFLKASYSVVTDVDTTVTFYIRLIDGSNFTTVDFTRDYVAGEIGVVTGHDIFENIPLDPDYEVELWANCGTAGATCTIAGGSSFGYVTDVTSVVLNNFNITAYDSISRDPLLNFTATNEATYNTTTGIIQYFTEDMYENITISAVDYADSVFLNHNTSVNINASMTPLYYLFDVHYSDYITDGGVNYTKNLNFSFDAICPTGESHRAYLIVGGSGVGYVDLTCDGTRHNNTGTYTHTNQNNNSVYMNWTGNSDVSNTTYFTWDLYAPTMSVLTFTTNEGFVDASANVSIRCYDSLMGSLTYNLTFNGNNLFYGNLTNNTLQTNSSDNVLFGNNTAVGVCNDLFYTTTKTYTDYIYKMSFSLIDERTNLPPSFAGFDSAIVYYDDNTTQLDLIGGVTEFNFTSGMTDKLRFEFIYNDTYVVTRYVDVRLFPSDEVRVCANNVGEDYYTQLLTSSSSSSAVVMKSVYSDCVVAADYIRFAYQDALILRAQTINTPYYLYTWEDNMQVFLASIDGSIESYINLDTLAFSQTAYDLDLLSDNIVFEKLDNQSIKIYYREPRDDNEELSIVITRTDTSEIVFQSSDFSDPNEFTIYLDYSTWSGLGNDTLLMVVVDIVNNDGSDDSFTKYFNLNAQSGLFTSKLAFFLSLTLALFGITFVAARSALGWFGFIIMLIAIALATFAPITPALLFLQAIEAICLVFIAIILFKTNYSTVA